MKSDRTIRTHLKALRRAIDDPGTDPLVKRVAYEVEQAIRWARETTVRWPDPLQSAYECADLIRKERP